MQCGINGIGQIVYIWFQVNKLSLNTSKTNFMVFTNKSCDDTYSVCMNGLHFSRVFVTTFLGVHMDCRGLSLIGIIIINL